LQNRDREGAAAVQGRSLTVAVLKENVRQARTLGVDSHVRARLLGRRSIQPGIEAAGGYAFNSRQRL
jgi:hypothetical protein